jgi:hypothetical protein
MLRTWRRIGARLDRHVRSLPKEGLGKGETYDRFTRMEEIICPEIPPAFMMLKM